MDNPSFLGFPWADGFSVGLFCLTVAAYAGAAAWVRHATGRLSIARGGRWRLLFDGLSLALLIAAIAVGWPTVPVAWVVLAVAVVAFTRCRDAAVPASRRYLTSKGVSAIIADIKSARASGSRGAASGRIGLRGQLAAYLQRFRKAAGKGRRAGRGPSASVAAESTAVQEGFAFLKKDGSVAVRADGDGISDDDGSAVSTNVRNARDVMLKAIRADATDLHFDPHEHEYFVRVRVDGVLRDVGKMEAETARGVVSAIKVIADMDIAERRRPQDGAFAIEESGDNPQALRHVPRRRPDRLRQDDDRVCVVERDRRPPAQHHHHRGSGRIPPRQHHADRGQHQGGRVVRQHPAERFAAGSGRASRR